MTTSAGLSVRESMVAWSPPVIVSLRCRARMGTSSPPVSCQGRLHPGVAADRLRRRFGLVAERVGSPSRAPVARARVRRYLEQLDVLAGRERVVDAGDEDSLRPGRRPPAPGWSPPALSTSNRSSPSPPSIRSLPRPPTRVSRCRRSRAAVGFGRAVERVGLVAAVDRVGVSGADDLLDVAELVAAAAQCRARRQRGRG